VDNPLLILGHWFPFLAKFFPLAADRSRAVFARLGTEIVAKKKAAVLAEGSDGLDELKEGGMKGRDLLSLMRGSAR
jgi:hypothetical protein